METIQLTSHKFRKTYISPRCEELDTGAEQPILTASYITPGFTTTNTHNGYFDARESGEFFDDDEGDDYDY